MSHNDRWWTRQRDSAAATLKGQNGNSSRTNGGGTQEERDISEASLTHASTSAIDTHEPAADARPLDALIHEDDDDFDDDDDVPGAFAVSRFRPSSIVSTGWDPTAQLNEETNEEDGRTNIPDALSRVVEEPDNMKRKRTKRFWLILSMAIFAVIIIAALVVIILNVNKSTSGDLATSSGANYTCENMAYHKTAADPFLQCECFQRIAFVGDDVRDIYDTIKTSDDFVDLLPSDLQVESCTPSNLALMWSAWDLGAIFDVGDVYILERIRNRFILALLYASWDGKEWETRTNWISNQSECMWYGVNCDEDEKIVQLLLPSNNMRGPLDSRLGALTDLVQLDLSQNMITGSITSEIWAMPVLADLRLSYNELNGTIPYDLGRRMRSLRALYLDGNSLTGSLPQSVGMTNLKFLSITRTKFVGTIPNDWGDLSQLEELSLFEIDGMYGTFPSSLGDLSKLTLLQVYRFPLTGTIPESIGNLTSLSSIFLGGNLMTGPIPTTIGLLSNLVHVEITTAYLNSSIPSELGRCTQLEQLDLQDNRFSGMLPTELGNLSLLNMLNLHQNSYLSGFLPDAVLNLSALTDLQLQDTDVKISNPDALCGREYPVNVIIDSSSDISCPCCSVR